MAALLAVVAVGVAGCGGGDESAGGLVWARQPTLVKPPRLPHDRILTGEVKNDSLERIDLNARDLRLLDPDGRRVRGDAVFLRGYAHQLFPPTQEPKGGIPERELLRLGVKAKIEPGRTTPLTVAWRLGPGERAPVRIDYGTGTLPIP